MELKHQIGVSLTLGAIGSILLYYVLKKNKKDVTHSPNESKARLLISKYKSRPSPEDIIEDNKFKDRIVIENKISESGIVYHDIRYPTNDSKSLKEEPSVKSKMSNADIIDNKNSLLSVEIESISTPIENQLTNIKSEISTLSVEPVEAIISSNIFQNKEISCKKETDNVISSSSCSSTGNNSHTSLNNGSSGENSESKLANRLVSNGINGDIPTTESVVKSVVAAKDKFEIEQRRENANQEIIQQCFNIPSKAVGKVIGKGGNTIKGIQRESGARLKFPQSRDRASTHQKLFVTGSLHQVTEAVSRLRGLMPSDSLCHEIISWTPEQALSGDLRPLDMIENTMCIGRVTHVTSPQKLWVQISRGTTGTDYNTMLTSLTTNMTETLGRRMYDLKHSLLPPDQIKQGAACAVMLEGRAWRARVMCPGTPDNNVHQVRLVDFGTPHTFTELYQLSSYYMTMPTLAVQCSLAHITKLDQDPIWPDEAAEYLEDKLQEGYVKVKTVVADSAISSVELYIESLNNNKGSIYLNRELVLEGYAKWDDS